MGKHALRQVQKPPAHMLSTSCGVSLLLAFHTSCSCASEKKAAGCRSACGVYTQSDQHNGIQVTTADVDLHLLQAFVGYTLVHILGQCNRFHFAQREARWEMVTAALGVLRAALQTSTLAPAGSEGQQAPAPALHRLVAQELAQQSYPETCLFINLPPPAGEAAVLCYAPSQG